MWGEGAEEGRGGRGNGNGAGRMSASTSRSVGGQPDLSCAFCGIWFFVTCLSGTRNGGCRSTRLYVSILSTSLFLSSPRSRPSIAASPGQSLSRDISPRWALPRHFSAKTTPLQVNIPLLPARPSVTSTRVVWFLSLMPFSQRQPILHHSRRTVVSSIHLHDTRIIRTMSLKGKEKAGPVVLDDDEDSDTDFFTARRPTRIRQISGSSTLTRRDNHTTLHYTLYTTSTSLSSWLFARISISSSSPLQPIRHTMWTSRARHIATYR